MLKDADEFLANLEALMDKPQMDEALAKKTILQGTKLFLGYIHLIANNLDRIADNGSGQF